jgi:hypothetical protein
MPPSLPPSSAGPAIGSSDRTGKARLAAVVYERTGVPIDPADPAFALVELNRLALQEVTDEVIRRIADHADGLPTRLSALTAVASKRMVRLSLERIAEELRIARREIEADVSRERDSLRQYGDASRAAQRELGAQLARSTKTVIVASGALAVLVVVMVIAAATLFLASR